MPVGAHPFWDEVAGRQPLPPASQRLGLRFLEAEPGSGRVRVEFSAGEEVKITFNLRGREWTSPKGEVRYFNSLDIWKIELVGERKSSDDVDKELSDEGIPF